MNSRFTQVFTYLISSALFSSTLLGCNSYKSHKSTNTQTHAVKNSDNQESNNTEDLGSLSNSSLVESSMPVESSNPIANSSELQSLNLIESTEFNYSTAKIRAISPPQKNLDSRNVDYLIRNQYAPQVFDKFVLINRHMGFNCQTEPPPIGVDCNEIKADKSITWDVGELTGFTPPKHEISKWQRGSHDWPLPSGSSAFQIHDKDVGSFINTWTFDHRQPVIGGGPHSVYQIRYSQPKTPWTTLTSQLTIQANVEIPWSLTWGSGVGQLSFFVYLKDVTTDTIFPYVIAIYDTRPKGVENGKEFLSHDTFHPFVSVPIMDGARYITKSPFSFEMQNQSGWEGLKFFRAHISRTNLKMAVNDLLAKGVNLSLNPSDYILLAAGILHEVSVGTEPENNVSMATHIRDLGIYEFY